MWDAFQALHCSLGPGHRGGQPLSLHLPAQGRQRPWGGVYVGAALVTQKTLPLRQWAEQHVLSETPFPSGSAAKLRVCVCCARGPRSGIALTLRVCSQVLIYFSSCFTHWIMSVGLFQNIDFFGYYMNIQIILFTECVFFGNGTFCVVRFMWTEWLEFFVMF